jgi:hypothetical protein
MTGGSDLEFEGDFKVSLEELSSAYYGAFGT